jgi:hypothetical protein
MTLPTRADIVSRLATSPPIEELLIGDDLERQHEISKGGGQPAAVLLLVVNHAGDPTVVFTQRDRASRRSRRTDQLSRRTRRGRRRHAGAHRLARG